MNLNLQGKVALVTGGTHGIGFSTATALAKEGCQVIVCSRTDARISETLETLNTVGGLHFAYKFDALEKESIERLIDSIRIEFPQGIDILINNVGGGGRWGDEDITKTELSVWDEVYQKNVVTKVSVFITNIYLFNCLCYF